MFGSYSHAGLTPDMRRLESELEHGRLAPDTELNALKPAERFRTKLAQLIARYPDSDPATVAADVSDGIRYAFLFDAEHHVDGVAQASKILEDAGYQLIELRPRWGSGEYQGVNSRWRDPAGILFEIQWHTPESWAAKQQSRAAHERISDPATPLEEIEQLRAYQRASSQVPVPPGAMLMRPYQKDS